MRLGSDSAQFDLSDADSPPVDRLDAVLAIAGEILEEYGSDPGATRVERLARWVTLNFGAPSESERAGCISHYACGAYSAWRVGEYVGLSVKHADYRNPEPISLEDARALATALVRAVEEAES